MMNKKWIRITVMLISITLIFTLHASYGRAKNTGKTEITFWFYPRYNMPGKGNGVYERELADTFMKRNKDIAVKVESIPWNGGPDKINIAIASNSMPDSVFDYPGRIIGYGLKGVLADLSDMLKPADKTDISPSILAHCQASNKLYMYPTAVSIITMAVNKKILKDAGALDLLPLSKPDRAWNIGDFEKALEAIKKLKGIQPIVLFAGNEQGDASIRMLIQNLGADFVSKDHSKVVINSEAGVRGIQWILDASKKGWIAPGAESTTNPDALDMFQQGRAAFSIAYGAANRNILLKMIEEKKAPADFDLAYLPLPTARGVKQKVEAQVFGYCVFNNKNKKRIVASKKFIDYLCNNKEIVKTIGAFPVRKSMGNLYDYSEFEFLQSLTSKLGDTGYTINNYAKVRTVWYPNLQAVLIGAKTPKAALDDFAKKATEIMNEK
jgi:multiple sugar transport system substrate-binding protein